MTMQSETTCPEFDLGKLAEDRNCPADGSVP
jgi:hypothetical protein